MEQNSYLNVLILEDHPGVAESLKKVVEREGATAYVTGDPHKALSWVRLRPFHICFIDCLLPKMNGMSVTKQLKSYNNSITIILMSGIMKESSVRSFPYERFLKKPFDSSQALEVFRELVEQSGLLKSPQKEEKPEKTKTKDSFSIEDIFSNEKSLETISQQKVKGFHVFYILSLYLKKKKTGCLKLMNEQLQSPYLIFFKDGYLYDFQFGDAQKNIFKKILIDNKTVTEDDWNQFNKSELILSLQESQKIGDQNLMKLREFQFTHSFKKLVSTPGLFQCTALDYESKVSSKPLSERFWSKAVRESISSSFLGEEWSRFFESMSSLRVSFDKSQKILEEDSWLDFSKDMIKSLTEEKTVKELLAQFSDKGEQSRQYLGYLLLCGYLQLSKISEEKSLSQSSPSQVKKDPSRKDILQIRLETMLKHIEGRTPFQIFKYFGASTQGSEEEVKRIYKEFVAYNHEDRLPNDASSQVRELNRRLFLTVKHAFEVLVDPEKKKEFQEKQKQETAKAHLEATALYEKSFLYVRAKKWDEAVKTSQRAMELSPDDNNIRIHWIHVVILSARARQKKVSVEVLQKIDTILRTHKDKNCAEYYFAYGLLEKEKKNFKRAVDFFDKAVETRPNFLEAKREREFTAVAIEEETSNTKIGKAISKIFKRKSG